MKSLLFTVALSLSASAFASDMIIRHPEKIMCYLRENNTKFSAYFGSTLVAEFEDHGGSNPKRVFAICGRIAKIASEDGSFVRISNDFYPDFEIVTPEELKNKSNSTDG